MKTITATEARKIFISKSKTLKATMNRFLLKTKRMAPSC